MYDNQSTAKQFMPSTAIGNAPVSPAINIATAVQNAGRDVSEVWQRLERLSTRLVGQFPEESPSTGMPPSPDGVFPTVYYTTGLMSEAMHRCHVLLDRIESALPQVS